MYFFRDNTWGKAEYSLFHPYEILHMFRDYDGIPTTYPHLIFNFPSSS